MSSSSQTSSSTSSSYSATTVGGDILQAKDWSPLELESDIQSKRIAKILDNAVYKTKLAVCFPILVRKRETLSRVLEVQDFKKLFRFCKDISDPMISSLIDYEAVGNIESGNTKLLHRLCPEMAYFLCMLSRYESLNSNVEEIIEKTGNSVPPGFLYLVELERLRDLTAVQTCKTAAEVLQAEITARKLEAENRKLVERVQEVSTILPEEKKHFEEKMTRKRQEISLLQKELISCRQVANAKQKETVRRSNYQMMHLTNVHNVKSSALNAIEVESREFYDKILKGNVSQESTLRAKRRKVEGQLNTFIAKYDVDMLEKQKELDQVTNLHDEELKLCRNLKLKLAEQDKEFKPLMLERDEEYHAEMTEKMNSFVVEHAARVIQNAWRQIGANRIEKKRLRKTLKKMQEANANAEKRAKADEAVAKKAGKDTKKRTRSTTTSEGSQDKSD